MGKKKPTFEEALRQLEAIADQIEKGQIGLEESITRYEEGMALVKQCREILAQAELRIAQLHDAPNGSMQAVPFTPPTEGKTE